MGKYYVPFTAHTPADRVREALERAEKRVVNLRRQGPQALELLHLLDEVQKGLHELRTSGTDVRAEMVRFETLQRQLEARKGLYVREVGAVLRAERVRVQPAKERWWWFADDLVAQERKHKLRRRLIWGAVAAVALIVAWVVYDRFVAPPPNVRQAYQLSTDGESLAEQGDLRGALAKFEAAAELDPSEPEYKVWMGVLLTKLDEVDQAEASYQAARSLYATELAFYLERGMMNLRLGDLEAASADAEKGVASNPESGWPYMLRANVRTAQGDYNAAVADMEKAAELASKSGDTQLEAYARTQRGMVIQLQAGQMVFPQESVTPSPDS